ncbi:MAG: hypothetical protein HY698_00550 [Deltaproteobacteria bacterium]|nr:hypothetical protein [Deltaproteobacteria bacterium]
MRSSTPFSMSVAALGFSTALAACGKSGDARPLDASNVEQDASSPDSMGSDSSDGGRASDANGARDAGGRCALETSEPLLVTTNGAVVELLHIVARGKPAVEVRGAKNVVLRNLFIEHEGGAGIVFSGADDLRIENVSVRYLGAPVSGPNPSSGHVNILGSTSSRVIMESIRLEKGSSGIYLTKCDDSQLRSVEGHDFRGPFPRGQLVQWNESHRGLLDGFSVLNPPESWPEDNVNVYKSFDAVIRNGLVDGNNAPSGVGVIFDGDTSTGLVEDVDAVRMGNGCFSAYAAGGNAVFRRTRCRDNICTDQGRGVPRSGALMWCGKEGQRAYRIEESTYYQSCNNNIVWPRDSFAIIDLKEAVFTPRAPLALKFCWQ